MPFATDESNLARARALRREVRELNHIRGALNLVHANQNYLFTRGTPPERDRARTERNRVRGELDQIDERLRNIRNEVVGFRRLGPLDPNSPQWEEEYQAFINEPTREIQPGNEN